jgi:hypothetical protein
MAQKEIASRAFIQPGPSLIERLNTGNLEEQNSHSIRSQPFASILAWMEKDFIGFPGFHRSNFMETNSKVTDAQVGRLGQVQ